jgi:hypothetical protein
MLADFQRLGQLQDFAMKDVQVEIAGDTAVVRYRIQGTPSVRACRRTCKVTSFAAASTCVGARGRRDCV